MFNPFNWFKRKQKVSDYSRGVAFANKELLSKGSDAIKTLESYVESARDFGTFDDFDRGILDTIEFYENQVLRHDVFGVQKSTPDGISNLE